MTATHEIAPDLFRLSIWVPDFDMQFYIPYTRQTEASCTHWPN